MVKCQSKKKKKRQFKNVNFFDSSPIYQTTNFTVGEGNGYPLLCSCQDNLMDRRAWWVPFHGSHKESDTTEQPKSNNFTLLLLFNFLYPHLQIFLIRSETKQNFQNTCSADALLFGFHLTLMT